MLEYAQDWVDHLSKAPNHSDRAGFVRRIEIAGDEAGVIAMLNVAMPTRRSPGAEGVPPGCS